MKGMATANVKSRPTTTKAKPAAGKSAVKPAAKATSQRKSRVFSISFPEGMARQVERLAAEEDRSISEYFRELFRKERLEALKAHSQQVRLYAASRPPSPYKEADVETLVDEVRTELANRRK